MATDPIEVDARIAAAEAALADPAVDGAGKRAARVGLVEGLAARYVQHGGPELDAVRLEQIAGEALADEALTAGQRQAVAMLRLSVGMVRVGPGAAVRGRGPALDGGVLDRVERWQESGPAAVPAGVQEVVPQLTAILGGDDLPPELRPILQVAKAAMNLLADVARPGWDGVVAPDVLEEMGAAAANAPSGEPITPLMRGLVTWMEGFDRSGERASRVSDLERAVADLPDDALLAPVLRADLAGELARQADLGGADAVTRVTTLLRQAVDGMPENHPLHAETVRMLAGALVATAAETSAVADREHAHRIAAQVLAGDPDGDTGRAEQLFLRALVGLLPGGAPSGSEDALVALVECIELLPEVHPLRAVALGQFGAALADRSLTAGLLDDAAGSVALLERAIAAAGPAGDDGAVVACVAGISRVNQAMRVGDGPGLAARVAELRVAHARMPEHHPFRPNVGLVLATADLRVAATAGAGLSEAMAALREAVAGPKPAGMPAPMLRSLQDTVASLGAVLDDDLREILAAADRMEAALVDPAQAASPLHRPAQLLLLGNALLAAVGTGRSPDGTARRAVGHLEEARDLLGPEAGVLAADVLRDLAVALRAADEPDRARRVAADALEHRAGAVLLQSAAADGIVVARGAATDAERLARWCLADGDVAGAAAAVELGRGLVLHATTSVVRVPELLDRAGDAVLAARWRQEEQGRDASVSWLTEAADGRLPAPRAEMLRAAAGLRLRVVAALRDAPGSAALFGAPTTVEIGAALEHVAADVLVYLIAGSDDTPGRLLLVDRAGAATPVEAPDLRDTAGGPLEVHLASPGPGRPGFRAPEWDAALTDLCDWAGPALLDLLLAALDGRPGSGPDGLPRVVLVPCGRLGSVPWAAARWTDRHGRVRRGCQDLVLSTAASARQLIDVAGRPALEFDRPAVLVGDPAEHDGADDEVLGLQGAFYPDAVLLGGVDRAVGRGTPAEVLAVLPGPGANPAPLVHLCCHAVATDEPSTSRLELTEPLTVDTVLRQGTRCPSGAAGPIIVCSACETDFTQGSHDEALTVATAFLAAGAVTVVGSRWTVIDRYTGVLMFAFHHFLRVRHLPAADALRAAQLWAQDPHRPVLPGMSEVLAGRARRGTLAHAAMWAAFAHHGR